MSGGLLVAGTSSDAGKSILVAGLCRWLARQGVRVAPFKAQNMALNSVVTADGAEIGRAQAAQAAAADVEPEAAMNPVLLKAGGDRRCQLMVLGRPVADVDAFGYQAHKERLLGVVLGCLEDLRSRFDVVVCEGAGSPAEINLRANDIANMGLARAARLPVLVVGAIDRGGVFASMFGTLALLEPADQALVAGWVVNKFRGDIRLLEPGLRQIKKVTHRPVFGVLPWRSGLWLDVEDSLDLARYPDDVDDSRDSGDSGDSDYSDDSDGSGGYGDVDDSAGADGPVGRPEDGDEPGRRVRASLRGHDRISPGGGYGRPGGRVLRVAVVRLPRLSNVTDIDALRAEPGVAVRLVTRPTELADTDLVVLPGTRATVRDLAWLRSVGLDYAVREHAAAGRAVLGICGGYQMLGRRIVDGIESRAGTVAGLGLLPVTTVFGAEKVLGRRTGRSVDGYPLTGYEIRHGRPSLDLHVPDLHVDARRPGIAGPAGANAESPGSTTLFGTATSSGTTTAEPFAADGVRVGPVAGSSWHGLLENDGFRRALLADAAARAGRAFTPVGGVCFADVRQRRLDALGDLVADHLDTDAVWRLVEGGPPAGLPFVPPGAP